MKVQYTATAPRLVFYQDPKTGETRATEVKRGDVLDIAIPDGATPPDGFQVPAGPKKGVTVDADGAV